MSVVTIDVKYTCGRCRVTDQIVKVPARLDPDAEDVVKWMEQTLMPHLMQDHYQRSPHCRPREFKQVMIPNQGAWVGAPTRVM